MMNAFGGASPLGNFLWLGTSLGGWGVLFFLGVGPTIGGFGLYLVSLGYLPATVANLIGALEPAFTAVWAYLLFKEQMTGTQVLGSLLVLASVVLLAVRGRAKSGGGNRVRTEQTWGRGAFSAPIRNPAATFSVVK